MRVLRAFFWLSMILLVFGLLGSRRDPITPSEHQTQTTTETTSSPAPESNYLSTDDPNADVLVGFSWEDYEEMMKLVNAKDYLGLSGLRLADRIDFVPNGTKVVVIDYGISNRVRIMEGEHIGREAYTPHEFVK